MHDDDAVLVVGAMVVFFLRLFCEGKERRKESACGLVGRLGIPKY